MDEGHQPKTEMKGTKGKQPEEGNHPERGESVREYLLEGTGEPPGIRTRDPRLKRANEGDND